MKIYLHYKIYLAQQIIKTPVMKDTGLQNLLAARGVYNLFQIPMSSLHTGFKAKTDAKAIKIEWIKLG